MQGVAWLGSVLLALCALPQAISSLRTGRADDLCWSFIGMWLTGEILLSIYTLNTGDVALLTNYLCNVICLTIICSVKLRG